MIRHQVTRGSTRRSGRKTAGSASGAAACAVVWLALVTLYLTWTPFVLDPAVDPLAWTQLISGRDVVDNLFLMVPIGVAVALINPRRPILKGLLAGALLSSVAEVGQLWLGTRFASPVDLLLNAAGAGLAAAAITPWRERFDADRTISLFGGLVFAAITAYFLTAGAGLRDRTRIGGWESLVPILIGNEVGGERPYTGTVEYARICTGPPSAAICATAAASAAEREALVRAAERSQRVEVVARLVSASSSQHGPARIITFASGTDRQNVMLGQEDEALIFRVWMLTVGGDTIRSGPELSLPSAITTGRPTDVSATFDAGTIRMVSRGGSDKAGRFTHSALTSPLLWNTAQRLTPFAFLATELGGALVLSVPFGLLFGALGRGDRPSSSATLPSYSSVVAAVLAAVPALGLILFLARPLTLESAVTLGIAVLAASSMGVGLSRVLCRRELPSIAESASSIAREFPSQASAPPASGRPCQRSQ